MKLFIAYFIYFLVSSALAAEGIVEQFSLEPFCFFEDFERDVSLSISSQDSQINFLGISNQRGFCGNSALKVDVQLATNACTIWMVLPASVPCEGELRLSARILVDKCEDAEVGIGANFIFPPTEGSGCLPINTFNSPSTEWRLQEKELVCWSDSMADDCMNKYFYFVRGENAIKYMDKLGIFITGKPGSQVVAYIDAIRIDGNIPNREDYKAVKDKRFEPVKHNFHEFISEKRGYLNHVKTVLNFPELVRKTDPAFRKMILSSIATIRSKIDELNIYKYDLSTPRKIQIIKSEIEPLQYALENLVKVSNALDFDKHLVTFVVKPAISNAKILPNTFIIPAPIADTLNVVACCGEYEPASFAVYALKEIRGLKVAVSDLTSQWGIPKRPGKIPSSTIDICVVKCWYQAGIDIWETNYPVLTPELLLKDENLVKVDMNSRQNFLRVKEQNSDSMNYRCISEKQYEPLRHVTVKDAECLQPVDIDRGSAKQFWLTIRVPDSAKAGYYRGSIILSVNDSILKTLPLALRVLPFELEEPKLQYSIFYLGLLSDRDVDIISSEGKTDQQYLIEMRNLKEHGINFPTIYQHYDYNLLKKIFKYRHKAGLPSCGPLYVVGLSISDSVLSSELKLKEFGENVRKWIDIAEKFYYSDVYIFGQDEAKTGESFARQRPAWCVVKNEGGKMFVACNKGAFESMACLLDLAVYGGIADKEESKKYKQVGSKIFARSNPGIGNEEPETYRRNYGLALWKANFNGAMNYAYQHGFGNIWNDFDDPNWRDHVFAYPTTDGLINTIQWEGFREGVDDVRYLSTLLKKIENAPIQKQSIASEAEEWLKTVDLSGDLDELRGAIIEWILKLDKMQITNFNH